MNEHAIVEHTRRWIASMVIGLNLCPFAQRVFAAEKIRYVLSSADCEKALLDDLSGELKFLAAAPRTEVETTLLIHPGVLKNFLEFNDFLDRAEKCIEDLDLDGIIQLASFHPAYQFADTNPEDAENYSNRSPYPMLHLLREASITEAAGNPDELLEIPERNIQTLRALGCDTILAKLKEIAP